MTKTQTTISIIAIILIFLFWRGKKRAKFGCTDLWDNMRNPSAEQIYTDTFNLTENDPDINTSLTEQSALDQTPLTKLRCLYSVDYLKTNEIVNINEGDSIKKCLCDNITI
tara:strand:+ start:3099 stop:3431 length:333 start_codon:yes stop_codon:yes gene_type:complete